MLPGLTCLLCGAEFGTGVGTGVKMTREGVEEEFLDLTQTEILCLTDSN